MDWWPNRQYQIYLICGSAYVNNSGHVDKIRLNFMYVHTCGPAYVYMYMYCAYMYYIMMYLALIRRCFNGFFWQLYASVFPFLSLSLFLPFHPLPNITSFNLAIHTCTCTCINKCMRLVVLS